MEALDKKSKKTRKKNFDDKSIDEFYELTRTNRDTVIYLTNDKSNILFIARIMEE